jgi:hypothetical protein
MNRLNNNLFKINFILLIDLLIVISIRILFIITLTNIAFAGPGNPNALAQYQQYQNNISQEQSVQSTQTNDLNLNILATTINNLVNKESTVYKPLNPTLVPGSTVDNSSSSCIDINLTQICLPNSNTGTYQLSINVDGLNTSTSSTVATTAASDASTIQQSLISQFPNRYTTSNLQLNGNQITYNLIISNPENTLKNEASTGAVGNGTGNNANNTSSSNQNTKLQEKTGTIFNVYSPLYKTQYNQSSDTFGNGTTASSVSQNGYTDYEYMISNVSISNNYFAAQLLQTTTATSSNNNNFATLSAVSGCYTTKILTAKIPVVTNTNTTSIFNNHISDNNNSSNNTSQSFTTKTYTDYIFQNCHVPMSLMGSISPSHTKTMQIYK